MQKSHKNNISHIDYKSFFDRTTEGIYRTTLKGKLIFANRALARIAGYSSPEEMTGRIQHTKQFYVNPQSRLDFLERINDHGVIHNFEAQVYRKDKTKIWISENAWKVFDTKGKLLFFEGTVQDITDRKRYAGEHEKRLHEMIARKAAEKAEKRFRTIFEQTPFSMQIFDKYGMTKTVNHAWEKLWGIPKKMVVNQYNVLHDPQLKETGSISYIKQAFKGKYAEIPAIQYDVQRTISSIRPSQIPWVKAYIFPIKDENNEIEQVVLMHQDITESKTAENELQYQKSVLEAQMEVSPDGIIVISPEGTIISCNKRFQEMWELPKKVFASRSDKIALDSAKDLLKDPTKFMQRVLSVYRRPRKSHDKLYLKDGRVLDRHGAPIRGADSSYKGYVWFLRDITHEVQLEKRKDDFISIASHELKTPLTSIKAFTQLTERYLRAQNDSKGIEYVSKMSRQLMRLTTLVDDLLDVSRMQSGKLVLDRKKVHIKKIVKDTLTEISPTIKTHTITIQGNTNACVYADEFRISQVITNFLTNAEKYAPKSEKIIVEMSSDTENVCVSVQDFGMGISDKKNLNKIFERFYRLESRSKHSSPGLGLGLYISSEIIKRHKGKIGVKSKLGKGSTFYFSLPILKD